MNDPRWTVDEDGIFRCDLYPILGLVDIEIYESSIGRPTDPDDIGYLESIRPAYNALVAAVRDAARLHAVTAERDALLGFVRVYDETSNAIRSDYTTAGDGEEARKRIDTARLALAFVRYATASSPGTETSEVGE